MTMDIDEKSKRDDDSQISTPVSTTSDSKFANHPVLSPELNAQEFIGANDPAIEDIQSSSLPSASREDTDGEEDEDEDEDEDENEDDDVAEELSPDRIDDRYDIEGESLSVPREDDVNVTTDETPSVEGITEPLNKYEDNPKRDVFSEPVTPQQPLTFTINFGDDKEVDTARYRNLFERYNARHRRNLSTSKVEVRSKQSLPSSAVPNTAALSPNFLHKHNPPSAHSEGYFSSDQEDETRRKADQLSRKLKQLGMKKSISKVPDVPERYDDGIMSRSYSERSTRENVTTELSLPCEKTQPMREGMKRTNRADMSLDLEEPANDFYRDQRTRKINPSTFRGEKNQRRNGEREIVEASPRLRSLTRNSDSRYERKVVVVAAVAAAAAAAAATASEKTTNSKRFYTRDEIDAEDFEQFGDFKRIDKLSSGGSSVGSENFLNYDAVEEDVVVTRTSFRSPNDATANGNLTNIDALEVSNFADDGSDGAVSEAGTYTIHKDYTDEEKARMDIDRVFSVGVVAEEESSEAYVHSFKMSISRDNNWISEWATQVAEHNSLPSTMGGIDGISKGLISPQSPQTPSKIPSPIHSRSRRLSRGRQEQSDSSLETAESYLRAKAPTATSPLPNNDRILVDSGGESDDDTSLSHNTPPQSFHRVGSARRSSLSDVLFARNSISEGRRSARNYAGSDARLLRKERVAATLQEPIRSPTHVLARLRLGRRNSSSLDRKTEYGSDTQESNCTSGRSSLKNYLDVGAIHAGSPVPPAVRNSASKLTNSPVLSSRDIAPARSKRLDETSPQPKNIGYFTCTENSPYMLRKSYSTTSYGQREDFGQRERGREPCLASVKSLHQNSPVPRRSASVQRSASNASVRNPKVTNLISARRGSFSSSSSNPVNDRSPAQPLSGKFNAAASDSSSETGDKQIPKSPVPPVTSGIKLNRAFSIRRARLNCEYDTTPSTTPEERRRKAQVSETRGAQVSASGRQASTHHRGRSVGNVAPPGKDSSKRIDPPKPRAPSMSRTDSGRISTRAPKSVNHVQHTRVNQKPSKDAHKKPGRSNSTLTSKEVEFQNWKRRKNYDPMKAAAEGKKKLDTSKKQHSVEDSSRGCESSVLRSASFHGTGGTLSLAADWSDNDNEFTDSNEYIRPPPPSSPQLGSDSDFETSSYLRATENVVSAMSARMIVRNPHPHPHPPPVDSGGESDEDTSRSINRPMHRSSLHPSRASDTESSDEPRPVAVQSSVANSHHSKVVSSVRKNRIDPRDNKKTPTAPLAKPRTSPRDVRGNVEAIKTIARTDSGRFSTRLQKNVNAVSQSKGKDNKKSAIPSSREVEMQNWKRRKSYDPMKAAMEGRRKLNQTKINPNVNLSPSSHVLRSQSFHGSVGLGVSDWSDEELTVSADEASLY